MTATRLCSRCGEEKPLEHFRKDNRLSSGRAGTCKACVADDAWRWRQENPEKVEEQAWRQHRARVQRQPIPEGFRPGCAECGEPPRNWYRRGPCQHERGRRDRSASLP